MYCGGFIIDNYNVLTAAHCISDYRNDPNKFSVVVGSVNLSDPTASGKRYQIRQIKVHPNYRSNNGWPNDIAMLRLVTPIIFNNYVRPAVLPARNETLRHGQPAIVSGYGQLNDTSRLSPILYTTKVFIESNSNCQKFYGSQYPIQSTNVCTRHPNQITGFCRGDSGGPLTVNGKVVGIVSYSIENGCAGRSRGPQVYTRVSEYINWIEYCRK
ncbi:chymotrypsin-like elastase family member 1 [Phymastichus coffea]|uniref:chymotrypsin-like elastase family member 1 n=1 Tax=Phymastichus coffea TaxID=108790 RepID=UPI00273C7D5C|nr:chymotrypsin-like elastase family member 1 [Phymastichus coffea]